MILQLVRESCVLGVAPRTEGKTPFHGLARALLQRGFGAFSYFKFSPPPPSPLGRDFGFRQGNWGNPTKQVYATKYLNFLSRFSYINGFLAKNIIFAELNRFVVYSM